MLKKIKWKWNLRSKEFDFLLKFFLSIIFLLFLCASLWNTSDAKKAFDERGAYQKNISQKELKAKSAYVFDATINTVLFEKNSDQILPLASLTKIMTAIVAYENLNLDTIVKINPNTFDINGTSGLVAEEEWYLKDLLKFMLIVSSNPAAKSIALESSIQNKDLIALMNKKASELGLYSMSFENDTGLDLINGKNGGYSSAKDIAKLFEYAVSKDEEIFEITTKKEYNFTSKSNISHHVFNTNPYVEDIPGILASKTGSTQIAGGNLALVLKIGDHKIIISVLGSDVEGRFSDAKILTDAVVETFNNKEFK